jgi:hypothetical protein
MTPGQSSRTTLPRASLASTNASTPAAATTAKPKFTYRHHRHDSHSVSAPPSNNPTTAPPAAIAP